MVHILDSEQCYAMDVLILQWCVSMCFFCVYLFVHDLQEKKWFDISLIYFFW